MSSRFDYVRYDDVSNAKQASLKAKIIELEALIDDELSVPPGDESQACARAKAFVMDHLEYAYMWCGKAIRDAQNARTGKVDLQEGRSNE